MKKIKKILLWSISILLAYSMVTAFYIGYYSCLNQTKKADVAIVLGAATWYDEVSPVYEERLNHGIQLYQEGLVDYIMVTGGAISEDGASDASLAKDYLRTHGIDESVILMEEKSRTTKENMSYGLEVMKEHQLDEALIVSDPLHMARSMFLTKEVGLQGYSSPTRSTRYQSAKTIIPFWIRETVLYIGYQWLSLLHLEI